MCLESSIPTLDLLNRPTMSCFSSKSAQKGTVGRLGANQIFVCLKVENINWSERRWGRGNGNPSDDIKFQHSLEE